MLYSYNKKLVSNAKALRKNMTPEEKHLWYDFLLKLPLTVNRQKNIGNYIVDFFIAEKRVVIEIDGLQHNVPQNEENDKRRDAELNALGIKVLRYTNASINKNFSVVCGDILNHLELSVEDMKIN